MVSPSVQYGEWSTMGVCLCVSACVRLFACLLIVYVVTTLGSADRCHQKLVMNPFPFPDTNCFRSTTGLRRHSPFDGMRKG